MLDEVGNKCKYCEKTLTLESLSADHKISKLNGGDDSRDNFQLVCKKCNRSKSNFNDDFFTELLVFASRWNQKSDLLGKLAQATLRFGRRY